MPSEFVIVRTIGDSGDASTRLVAALSRHGFIVVPDLDVDSANAAARLEYDAAAVVLACGNAPLGERPRNPTGSDRIVPVALTASALLPESFTQLDPIRLSRFDDDDDCFNDLLRRLGALVAEARQPSMGGSSMSGNGWMLAAGDLALEKPLNAIEGLEQMSHGVSAIAPLLAHDDAQTKPLLLTFAEIGNSYRVVQEAISDFACAGDDQSVNIRAMARLRGGILMDDIHNGRGHCKRIEARYWAFGGPRSALIKNADSDQISHADQTFMAIGTADDDLFSALDSVGFLLTTEARAIHLLALTGQSRAAHSRFVGAVQTLTPIEDSVSGAMRRFRELLQSLGYAEGTTSDVSSTYISGATFIERQIIMGDQFSNIQGSTIINRSTVKSSLNAINSSGEEELAAAMAEVAAHLEAISAAPDAVESYEDLIEEAANPNRKGSRLKAFWSQLTELAPSVSTLAGAVKAITALF